MERLAMMVINAEPLSARACEQTTLERLRALEDEALKLVRSLADASEALRVDSPLGALLYRQARELAHITSKYEADRYEVVTALERHRV